MKLYSKDGVEMMEIKSIEAKDDIIVIRGKMMKSMAAVIHVKPEDAWAAFRLFPFKLLVRLPVLMMKGWQRTRAAADVSVR